MSYEHKLAAFWFLLIVVCGVTIIRYLPQIIDFLITIGWM